MTDAGLRAAIGSAIRRLEGEPVELLEVRPVAEDRAKSELKQVGYGEPLLVVYRKGQEERRVVFRTMAPNWFGHDRRADRAALSLLAADTYGDVPAHVRALDVGAFGEAGELVSLRGAGEFYLVTTYAEGRLYAGDLRRIEHTGRAEQLDIDRACALARYLAELHRERLGGPAELYVRAVRDLVGSGEGIFGIADAYPPAGPIAASRLAAIEQRCVAWRWKLRARTARLARTHGDFHPYNVLFREGTDFTLLDASRGGTGEPADDVAAMTINYLFGGAVHPLAWSQGLSPLWDAFWSTYLDTTGDEEIAEVIAPFFAWRALVVACPAWYPSIPEPSRDALLSFAEHVLDAPAFHPGMAARFVTKAGGNSTEGAVE